MGPLWGIDLGGTKIEGVILDDSHELSILKRLRVPTEASKGYKHIINQLGKLIEVLTGETGLKPDKIGIATPGILDPTLQIMKNCNTAVMNGQPMQRDISEALNMQVVLANDANCFAIAEHKFGAVKHHSPEARVSFGVIMGTGVGGGLVVDDKVLTGRQGIAGEWGHSFLDDSGGPCFCGNTGCVETLISGSALERYYESIMGIPLNLKEILALHETGEDPVATRTIQRLIHFFGKGLSNVINIVDPDVIVLGGGLSNIDLLYTEGIESIKKYVFNDRLDTIILKPELGDSAGVFGAALL